MRRIVYSLLAAVALLAFAATPALAGHSHRRSHERRHLKRGHRHPGSHARARVRHRTFGPAASGSTGSGSSSGSTDQAGTVFSFTNGVLTITLNDGSMVSGSVTPATEIECQASEIEAGSFGADDRSGGSGDHSSGDSSRGYSGERSGDGSDRSGSDEPGGEDNQANCMSALHAGAAVREAELALRPGAGATWDKVELVGAATGGEDS